MVKLIECPRDAMQGLHDFIPTATKAKYINQLLKVGFDTIDFGSFVSPKAIPQLRDTAEVLNQLDLTSTNSNLLAIVANKRGATDACNFQEIDFLGFPFSISETFQQRNTNSSIEESLARVADIQNLCFKHNKRLVVYISMAFGNPYGDLWNSDIVLEWISKLTGLGVETIALSDTTGISTPDDLRYIFDKTIPEFFNIEIGAHLHTNPVNWEENVNASYQSGCRRFDGAIKGFGGCPMASDDLTGNMATENLIQYFSQKNINLKLNYSEFNQSMIDALNVFPT
jgi:hydroxymethylglutaryl-CoA lyase